MGRQGWLRSLLVVVGPGILVAATGVGAGDLATASFTGIKLGVAVLWAVVLGAFLKFVLNEGLARWQLATGQTLLEGCVRHYGWPFRAVFLAYLLVWSFFVGAALMGACGVTAHAIFPLFDDAASGKLWLGVAHSVVGVVLVLVGGFKLFERVMHVCIGIMFITVLVTAVLIGPDWGAVSRGLLVPGIPQFTGEGLSWTIALMGGVGGTLTVMCYGYWIRESGREGEAALRTCRIDLAAGYTMTALFGVAMVIIGSHVEVKGSGAGLMVTLAERLTEPLGSMGKWAFLIGAWGAVFSSLLGVWQSVPYIFADFCSLLGRGDRTPAQTAAFTTSWTYRAYLLAIALVPILGLRYGFEGMQKIYAVFGAFFMPMLALALLHLNSRAALVGERSRNRPLTVVILTLTLLFFLASALLVVRKKLGGI